MTILKRAAIPLLIIFLTACSAIEKNIASPEKEEINAEYSQLLTDTELQDTRAIATDCYPDTVALRLAENDDSWYKNDGIEAEYEPGNIIIYYVVTKDDKENGNPEKKVSVARKNADSPWEVINKGY